MNKPKVNAQGQQELEKVENQVAMLPESIKEASSHRNFAPLHAEIDPQTKMSNREINQFDAPYIKPIKAINSKEPFNEKYRAQYEHAKQYIRCVVENHEIIGEQVETWTKRFAGISAEFWKVPVNKPVMIPRYLADQLAQCYYNRLVMQDVATHSQGAGTFYGALAVDRTVHRIDARPAQSSFISMAG